MILPFVKGDGFITIEVSVEPRGSKAGLNGIAGSRLRVKLTAAPVDGAANKQLIEVLAKELGVKKGAIRIIRGMTSKHKVIRIEGIDSLSAGSCGE